LPSACGRCYALQLYSWRKRLGGGPAAHETPKALEAAQAAVVARARPRNPTPASRPLCSRRVPSRDSGNGRSRPPKRGERQPNPAGAQRRRAPRASGTRSPALDPKPERAPAPRCSFDRTSRKWSKLDRRALNRLAMALSNERIGLTLACDPHGPKCPQACGEFRRRVKSTPTSAAAPLGPPTDSFGFATRE
jgi:hypothetical protein